MQVLGIIWLKITFVLGCYLNTQPKHIATLDFVCDVLFDIKLCSRESLTIFY